jgi:LEA14-like dessication related protein
MTLSRIFGTKVLVVALGMLSLGACAPGGDIIPPSVRLADLRPLSGGLLEQRFRMDLRVSNPNNFELDIDGLSVDLDLNGLPFATGLGNQPVSVPRLGDALVSVEATTGILELARQMFGLAQSGNLTYRLDGIIYLGGIGGGSVPFEQSGSLDLESTVGGLNTFIPRAR